MFFHTLRVALVVAVALLAGCGGGSGGSGGSSSGGGGSSVQTFGTFALVMMGGGAPGIKHAWVQVEKVALNEDADRPWDPQDSSWSVIKLTAPVAVDLASAAPQFVVGSDRGGVSVEAKTYKQVRIFFVAHDDAATLPTVKPRAGAATQLIYHAQLEYDDDGLQIVPIEWANYQSGVKLDQGVVITGGKSSALYARLDAERSLVRFDGDAAQDSIVVRPRTYTYLNAFTDITSSDGGKASAIQGWINPNQVCGEGVTTNCVSDLIVSLHATSGDEKRMENWGSVRVRPILSQTTSNGVTTTQRDAVFTLGPVSYSLSADKNGEFVNPQKYDVMIRGRGMKTMLIKNVTLDNLGSFVACSGGDALPLIELALDDAPRSVVLSNHTLETRPGRVGLGFKIDGGLTYEAFSVNPDPFTGRLTTSNFLSIPSSAKSKILVAEYDDLKAPCGSGLAFKDRFQEVVPSSGLDQWIAYGLGTFYTTASQSSPFTFSGTEFDPVQPMVIAGIVNGQVSVVVSGLGDVLDEFSRPRAQLIAADHGGIVQTKDLLAECSTWPCTVQLTLPAGLASIATDARALGVYEFAIRYWDANDPRPAYPSASNGTMKWARAAAFANLRSATSASVTISVP